MNILKKLFLTLVLLFSISGSLNAAEEGQTRFGIELGWAPVDLEAEKTAQQLANLSGSTVGVTYDTGSFVGRIFGDYGVSSNLSLEFGFFQSSSADATYTIGADSASEGYDASGLDFSVVLSGTDGWFGKFGMHSSTVEGVGTITIGGTSYSVTASQDGTGPLLGFGFEADDYRYSMVHYVDVGDTTDYTMLSVGWLF